MSKKKIERARQLIRSGDLKAARKILITLPDDERAQRWIDEIDYRLERDVFSKSVTKANNRNVTCLAMMVTIVSAFVCILALVPGSQRASEETSSNSMPSSISINTQVVNATSEITNIDNEPPNDQYSLGEQLGENFYADPEVLFVRLAFLTADGDAYRVYTEVDVNEGFVNVQMADRLLNYVQNSLVITSFSVILNDGASIPTDFTWSARRGWQETRMETSGIVPVMTPTLGS